MKINCGGTAFEVLDFDADLFNADSDMMSRHWLPQPGQVCFDVGFGPGPWALAALSRGASVFAFDPKPICVKILMDSIFLNKFTKGFVLPFGLWDKQGVLPFSDSSFIEGYESGPMNHAYPVTTLDEFMKIGINRLDFLNIDAEASELEILIGGHKSIQKFKPKIIIEVHKGVRVQDIKNELCDYSFQEEKSFLIAKP